MSYLALLREIELQTPLARPDKTADTPAPAAAVVLSVLAGTDRRAHERTPRRTDAVSSVLAGLPESPADDRHTCSECRHYCYGGHCSNWRAAGYLRPTVVAAAGPPMRCRGFVPEAAEPKESAPMHSGANRGCSSAGGMPAGETQTAAATADAAGCSGARDAIEGVPLTNEVTP